MCRLLSPPGRLEVMEMATRRVSTSRSSRVVRVPVTIKTGSSSRRTTQPVRVQQVTRTVTYR